MKALFATAAILTLALGVVGIHVLGKKTGRKEAVNILRKQQLEQVDDDLKYQEDIINSSNNDDLIEEAILALNTWYTAEVSVINEMYDEILNNL